MFYVGAAPGDHTVRGVTHFRGEGPFRGWRFELRSSHIFTVQPGRTMSLTGVTYEKGADGIPVEERPVMRWSE